MGTFWTSELSLNRVCFSEWEWRPRHPQLERIIIEWMEEKNERMKALWADLIERMKALWVDRVQKKGDSLSWPNEGRLSESTELNEGGLFESTEPNWKETLWVDRTEWRETLGVDRAEWVKTLWVGRVEIVKGDSLSWPSCLNDLNEGRLLVDRVFCMKLWVRTESSTTCSGWVLLGRSSFPHARQ